MLKIFDSDFTPEQAEKGWSQSFGPGITAWFYRDGFGDSKLASIEADGFDDETGIIEAVKAKIEAPAGIANEGWSGLMDMFLGVTVDPGRKIWIENFDESVMRTFIRQVIAFDNEDPTKPIFLMVDSPGGYADSMNAMLGHCEIARSPLVTVNVSYAMSAGGYFMALAAKPGMRFAFPNSRIMIHEVLYGMRGNIADHEGELEESQRMQRDLFTRLAAVTKLSYDQWVAEVRNNSGRREIYYDTAKAIELGLIDAVLTPEAYAKFFTKQDEKKTDADINLGVSAEV